MNLLFRVLRVLWLARFRRRTDAFDETVIRFRVWPTDLDPLLHMNNGRYLTIMDLGRADAILRNGLRRAAAARGWFPVVASETIRFRESLGPFALFELRTRLLGWDDRSFYMRQTFRSCGKDAAVGIVRIRFVRRGGGTVPAAEVAEALRPGAVSPELPAYVRQWQEAEAEYSRR